MRSPFLANRIGRTDHRTNAANPRPKLTGRIREALTKPSGALAVIALCLAMVGTASAAKMISGADIKNNSVTGKDVKDHSLTKSDVKGNFKGDDGATGPAGPQGPAGPAAAVAYGRMTLVGGQTGIDQTRSKNISVADGDDFTCVDAKVPVKTAIVTTDYTSAETPPSIPEVLYDTSGCPAGTDVQVAFKRANNGMLILVPFTIAFQN